MKYISQFYDINKKTQTEQVLQNMSDIDDLKNTADTLQENIDTEIQDRTDADATLAYDIADLQSQINAFGNVFKLKGTVATYDDLPASDNTVGDVYYVEDEAVGYVWIDDNGTERWEQLGLPIDLSDYVTTSDLALTLDDYQPKLTAGTNISIIGDTISATQPDVSGLQVKTGTTAPSVNTSGIVGQFYLNTATGVLYQCVQVIASEPPSYTWQKMGGNAKQNVLTAGTNITIDADNVISASGGASNAFLLDGTTQTLTASKIIETGDGTNQRSLTLKNTARNTSIELATYGSNDAILLGNKPFIIMKEGTGYLLAIYGQAYTSQGQNGTYFYQKYVSNGISHQNTFKLPDLDTSSTKTIAIIDDIKAKVPDAPTTDGTYTLKVVVSSGVPTYQWVLDI